MKPTPIDSQIAQLVDTWGYYTITAKNPMVSDEFPDHVVEIITHVIEIAEGFRTLAAHTVIKGWDATVYIPYDEIISIDIDSPSF